MYFQSSWTFDQKRLTRWTDIYLKHVAAICGDTTPCGGGDKVTIVARCTPRPINSLSAG